MHHKSIQFLFFFQSLFLKLVPVPHLVLMRGSPKAAVASNFLSNVINLGLGCDLFIAVASWTITTLMQ